MDKKENASKMVILENTINILNDRLQKLVYSSRRALNHLKHEEDIINKECEEHPVRAKGDTRLDEMMLQIREDSKEKVDYLFKIIEEIQEIVARKRDMDTSKCIKEERK